MELSKSPKNRGMNSCQSAVAAAAFVTTFMVAVLITAVWDDFLCWIGGKNNLSGWVQAIGSLILIAVTIVIWYNDKLDSKEKENQTINQEKIKFRIYLSSNYHLISNLTALFRMYSLHVHVANRIETRNLPGFRRNCFLRKKISRNMNEVIYDFSSLIIQLEVDQIPQPFVSKILDLRNKVIALSILNQLIYSSSEALFEKYDFDGSETYLSADIPEIDEIEELLEFNFYELPEWISETKKMVNELINI